jgi:hypothetical protein
VCYHTYTYTYTTKTTGCLLRPIWTNPRDRCTTTTSIPHSLTSEADWQNRNVWVTQRFRLCLDHGLIDRASNRQSIIPERQTKWFELQLRKTKLQINMLSPPDLHSSALRLHCSERTGWYMVHYPHSSTITDHSSAQSCDQHSITTALLCVFSRKFTRLYSIVVDCIIDHRINGTLFPSWWSKLINR